MNNKLRTLIEFIGLDFKKEIIKLSLFFALPILIGVLAFIFLKEITFLLLGLIFGGVLLYALYSNYENKRKTILNNRDDELINVISYLKSFISNGNNVYLSFKKIIEYSSPWMKEKIEQLLKDIDQDKSVKPYIDFSSNFQIKVAKNIMLSIYQMVDEGEGDIHLRHFENLLARVSNEYQQSKKEKKKKSLSQTSVFPVCGAALITILLTFSIVSIMGDLLDVI